LLSAVEDAEDGDRIRADAIGDDVARNNKLASARDTPGPAAAGKCGQPSDPLLKIFQQDVGRIRIILRHISHDCQEICLRAG